MPPVAPRLRPLNRPRLVKVEADADSRPVALVISGRRLVVEEHLETWRIDDEWWRPRPVARRYWRVLLEDGRVVDVYHGLASGRWFQQSY